MCLISARDVTAAHTRERRSRDATVFLSKTRGFDDRSSWHRTGSAVCRYEYILQILEMPMRLIDRRDTSLAAGLILGAM